MHKYLLVFFILLALGWIAYSNVWPYPFVHDDVVFIVENPVIRQWENLPYVFRVSTASSDHSGIVNQYYRPVLDLLSMIQYHLFGLNPSAFHLFNVILHAINAFLVFLFIAKFSKKEGMALCVAILFLVHPIQTEAVACVSGVSNLLLAFFLLGSLLLYIESERKALSPPLRFSLLVGSGVAYALAFFTKEQALIFPVLLGLFEVCRQGKIERRRGNLTSWLKNNKEILGKLGSYFILTGALLFLRKMLLVQDQFLSISNKAEFLLRLLAVPNTILMYLRLFFLPIDLHYYRSVDILAPSGWSPAIFVVVVSVVFYAALRWGKEKFPLLVLGTGWFLISLVPVLNIIPIVHEYSFVAAFEHFLYFPSIGVFLVLGAGAQGILEKLRTRRGKAALSLMSLVTVTCLMLTLHANTYWRGEIPLFERAVKYQPHMGRVRILLGKAYEARQDYARAIPEFQVAARIMQSYLRKVRLPSARNFYLKFLKDIYSYLGFCYGAQGNFPKAVLNYQLLLGLDAQSAFAYNNLGTIYLRLGSWKDAEMNFQKAVMLEPSNLSAMNNLAVSFVEQGKKREAERIFRKILAKDPKFGMAEKNLKRLLGP